MQITNLAELYDLAPLHWSDIEATLAAGLPQAPEAGGPNRHTCWLSTVNADGSPHLTGIGALWAEGSFWFETGRHTRKGRNLARDPRCALSIATERFDLAVQGAAVLISDPPTVAALAARWAAEGWPVQVDESGSALTAAYSAPSAGPPPWQVYRLAAGSATALADRRARRCNPVAVLTGCSVADAGDSEPEGCRERPAGSDLGR